MVPAPGDVIFVPDVNPGEAPGQPFDERSKRGGFADVGRVQEAASDLHFVSITNFGGMQFLWEGYLENLQDALRLEKKNTQAGII